MYGIRMVDTSDEDVVEALANLYRLTFFDGAAVPGFELRAWWHAHRADDGAPS